MGDPRSFYVGWLVDASDREQLLEAIPPRYAEVVAHHVTLKFGDREATIPTATAGEIVGMADDGAGVQAAIVRIGGTTRRPDGGVFHITWSLGAGREAKESNAVIRDHGWVELPAPLPVRLEPRAVGG